jgi:hypothetical protein
MYKHFVIYHKYHLLEQQQSSSVVTVKCNPRFPDASDGADLVEADLPFYNPRLQSQETPYHAASFLYHAYKNGLHRDLDYIGFSEYDLVLESGLLEYFEVVASLGERIVIPLSHRWPFEFLAAQTQILAANRQCMSTILQDYNEFWQTQWSLQELLDRNPTICTQQSFWCDRASFERLMKFICHVVEQGLAERKGSRPRPSTLMERYIGLALYLDAETEAVHVEPRPQTHLGRKEWQYDQSKIEMTK